MGCVRLPVAASMVLAVGIALVATGCVSARVVPPGPTPGELTISVSARLDQAWFNTGLDGLVERPEVELVEAVDDEDGFFQLAECLGKHGYAGFGMSDGPEGVQLQPISGDLPTEQMQLDFYTCFAGAPTLQQNTQPVLSSAQLQYLYDYYQESVIPCLEVAGIHIETVPTREVYLSNPYGTWTPYEPQVFTTGLTYDQAVQRCGDPHAGFLPERPQGGFVIASFENNE